MAVATVSTPSACAEAACAAPRPSAVERRFAQMTLRLRDLVRGVAALEDALPGSDTFHRTLRAVELAEERVAADLRAIIHAPEAPPSDLHLRQFCWKLHLKLSIEDGEDAALVLDRLHAVPDLLDLPLSVPGAGRVNGLIGACLDALDEMQARDVPALQGLRADDLAAPDAPDRDEIEVAAA